uniref:Uncharacterized protein n=1 Tax=Oryzias sinensis TaxID=183150 RepID=A0A8C7ZSX9_9TELE
SRGCWSLSQSLMGEGRGHPGQVRPSQNKTFSSLLHSTSVCQYCCQWLKPDDVRVRLRPKRRPSPLVQSILLRKARGKRLSVMQKKLLFRFQKSSSVLVRTQNTTKTVKKYR